MTTTITIDFYYDAYEKEFGDGFYPIVKTTTVEPSMQETLISFQEIQGVWKQTSNDMIYGLDCDQGKLLLDILNSKLEHCKATKIINSMYITIYPKN